MTKLTENIVKRVAILGEDSDFGFSRWVYISCEDVNFKIHYHKGNDSSDTHWEDVDLEVIRVENEHTKKVLIDDIPLILDALSIKGRPAVLILEEIPNFIAVHKRDEYFGKLLYRTESSGWSQADEEMKISFCCNDNFV